MRQELVWHAAPSEHALLPGDVHLWRADLDLPPPILRRYEGLLSRDERERAARFLHARDRARFVTSRAILRTLLAGYLGVEPRTILFGYGPRGKPRLEMGRFSAHLRFNLSHSARLALYAFALEREVGVDLEQVRPFPAAERIARRLLTVSEQELYFSVPPGERRRALFFRYWTRKEALIKAFGAGLSFPANRWEVPLFSGAVVHTTPAQEAAQARPWTVYDLVPAPNFVGALLVEGTGARIACWNWPAAERGQDRLAAGAETAPPVPVESLHRPSPRGSRR